MEDGLGKLLGPLSKFLISKSFPLMKNVLKTLAKNVLIPLKLTVAASATDTAIQKKTFDLCMTALLISNEEVNAIMKIVQSFEESGLFIIGASFLGNLLTDKSTIRAGQDFQCCLLTNFEIQKY